MKPVLRGVAHGRVEQCGECVETCSASARWDAERSVYPSGTFSSMRATKRS